MLIVRAQPADEAALFFGGALVVEGDEAGEELLFERLGIGTATGEDVGGRCLERRSMSVDAIGRAKALFIRIDGRRPPLQASFANRSLHPYASNTAASRSSWIWLEHGDEALVVDVLFLGGQRLRRLRSFSSTL